MGLSIATTIRNYNNFSYINNKKQRLRHFNNVNYNNNYWKQIFWLLVTVGGTNPGRRCTIRWPQSSTWPSCSTRCWTGRTPERGSNWQPQSWRLCCAEHLAAAQVLLLPHTAHLFENIKWLAPMKNHVHLYENIHTMMGTYMKKIISIYMMIYNDGHIWKDSAHNYKKHEKWANIKNPAYHVEPVTIGNHSGTSSGKTQSGEFAPSASLWIVFLHRREVPGTSIIDSCSGLIFDNANNLLEMLSKPPIT